MSVKIQVNIFGQLFTISASNGEEEYYREVASKLNKKLEEWTAKSNIRNEMKAAAQVAFMLALENDKYKAKQMELDNIDCRLDEIIKKIDV